MTDRSVSRLYIQSLTTSDTTVDGSLKWEEIRINDGTGVNWGEYIVVNVRWRIQPRCISFSAVVSDYTTSDTLVFEQTQGEH